MNLTTLLALSMPDIQKEFVSMRSNAERLEGELADLNQRIVRQRDLVTRREDELKSQRMRFQQAEERLAQARVDLEAKTVSKGAVTMAQNAIPERRRHIERAEEALVAAKSKLAELEKQRAAVTRERQGLLTMLAISDAVYRKKRADMEWEDHRRSLFNDPAGDVVFMEEMTEHAATVHRINEEMQRLEAERGRSADRLRAFVQARPDGYYQTSADDYPAKLFGRLLVYVMLTPRYFYDRRDVARLLGHEPEEFAPEFTVIERKSFEDLVRKGKVKKSGGDLVTIDEAVLILKVEYTTPRVVVRHLAEGERSPIQAVSPEAAEAPIEEIPDQEAARWFKEQGARSLRDVVAHPRRAIEAVFGKPRVDAILGKLFSR